MATSEKHLRHNRGLSRGGAPNARGLSGALATLSYGRNHEPPLKSQILLVGGYCLLGIHSQEYWPNYCTN